MVENVENNTRHSGTFEKQKRRNKIVGKVCSLTLQDFRRFRNRLKSKFTNGAVTAVLSDIEQIRVGHMNGFRREHAEEAFGKCGETLRELGL